MRRNFAVRDFCNALAPALVFLLLTGVALAQNGHLSVVKQTSLQSPPVKTTVAAVLLSDIHFEPFWDPAKVPQLATAPVDQWKAILAAPPSSDQPQRFQALQQSCHTRGADTPFTLYDSALKAMRKPAAGAAFVTVSGDLVSHSFDCKYNSLFPAHTPESYRAFVEKTIDYVIDELYAALPGVPVYVALGNNDSDCGDYRLDAHGEFLSDTGKEVTKHFPATERENAQKSFADGGYYSIALPAPIENARLLVLDDIFMSKSYKSCAGKEDSTAADAQLKWLSQQLAEARVKKEKVWIMGHIPPGVDLHATVTKMVDVCGGQKPVMYLSSEKMADELTEFDDVIDLAVFAHTHMDELHLLKGDKQSTVPGSNVAIKLVSSISPINGNHPSFTIAEIDPATAKLKDYRVYAASNQSGIDATWPEEYDFARSYHEAGVTAPSLGKLLNEFSRDPSAKTQASQDYIHNFFVGAPSTLLNLVWPQYVCATSNDSAEAFKACVCPAAH
jgi:sphingomyelin phosphodiesterase acid-like 3